MSVFVEGQNSGVGQTSRFPRGTYSTILSGVCFMQVVGPEMSKKLPGDTPEHTSAKGRYKQKAESLGQEQNSSKRPLSASRRLGHIPAVGSLERPTPQSSKNSAKGSG